MMVIEWLTVRVPEELREQYIKTDMQIWTPALEQYAGFLSKEIWINPTEPTELVIMIRWASREQWKAIPMHEIEAITQKFDQAFGAPYEMEETEFQVRKFSYQG